MRESNEQERDPLTGAIIGAAIEVHSLLGPGLLESVYEACLAWELRARHIEVEEQVAVPVIYKGLRIALATDSIWSSNGR